MRRASVPTTRARQTRCAARASSRAALHNNCSGKHAGILALCKVLGADPATYLSAEQSRPAAHSRVLRAALRRRCRDLAARHRRLRDSGLCDELAQGRARRLRASPSLTELRRSDAEALRVVRDAMMRYPQYVAGTGQLDTELMIAGDGTIVSKAGAEGVHGVAAIAQGYGYVSKVLDGNSRARGPSTIAALRLLGSARRAESRSTRSICAADSV